MTRRFQEYDVVRSVRMIADVPAGSIGTILMLYDGGTHAEVEFSTGTQKMTYTTPLEALVIEGHEPEPVAAMSDVFISSGVPQGAIRRAVETVFAIPASNIFVDDEDTSGWSDAPQSAFIYSYAAGAIGWKLELTIVGRGDFDEQLEKLARLLDAPVFHDRRSKEGDDRADAFVPTLVADGARLVSEEDQDGNMRFSVKWDRGARES